jgi:hypothetical protein
MTNSAPVTIPDSTGSGNRTGSMSALSRSASASAPVTTGYAPQVTELDGSAAVESFAFGSMFSFSFFLSDAGISFGQIL